MKLFYYKAPAGNFGDDLNKWLWDALLPGYRNWRAEGTIIGVGTILNSDLSLPSGKKIVLGSGVGYGTVPKLKPKEIWDIRALRGPRSAKALNVSSKIGIIDPAMMLPRLPKFSVTKREGSLPLFIPHHSNDTRHNWEKICTRIGAKFVSPVRDANDVIDEIVRSPLVLAESMHAAIIADAFRVPWIAISVSGTLNKFKWMDWCESLGMTLNVTELFPECRKLMATFRRSASKNVEDYSLVCCDYLPPKSTLTSQGNMEKKVKYFLRNQLENLLVTDRLQKALNTEPSLSKASILDSRQDAFEEVLCQVRTEYGT